MGKWGAWNQWKPITCHTIHVSDQMIFNIWLLNIHECQSVTCQSCFADHPKRWGFRGQRLFCGKCSHAGVKDNGMALSLVKPLHKSGKTQNPPSRCGTGRRENSKASPMSSALAMAATSQKSTGLSVLLGSCCWSRRYVSKEFFLKSYFYYRQ